MWCSSADPGLILRRTLHQTFIAEGFARGQLDLVVAQAVLGPGLVDDLVDLLPLAELAEVAVRHCACGAAAACRGGYTRRGGPTVRSAARVIAAEPCGTCAMSERVDAAFLACLLACAQLAFAC